jgi:hypothetical protein
MYRSCSLVGSDSAKVLGLRAEHLKYLNLSMTVVPVMDLVPVLKAALNLRDAQTCGSRHSYRLESQRLNSSAVRRSRFDSSFDSASIFQNSPYPDQCYIFNPFTSKAPFAPTTRCIVHTTPYNIPPTWVAPLPTTREAVLNIHPNAVSAFAPSSPAPTTPQGSEFRGLRCKCKNRSWPFFRWSKQYRPDHNRPVSVPSYRYTGRPVPTT